MLYYIGNLESFDKLTAQPIMTICMFTASWCRPCSLIKPKVIEYSETKTNVNCTCRLPERGPGPDRRDRRGAACDRIERAVDQVVLDKVLKALERAAVPFQICGAGGGRGVEREG